MAFRRNALQNHRRSGIVTSGVSNGESVVATFFLIRYQSVVASRREINFARQLCRISFFISPLEQQFADAFAEGFGGKAALDSAAMTNRYPAGLFRDDDGDCVGFFGNAQPRAVAQAETAIEGFALTHRENAGSRGDPSVAHDHATVMQRGFWMKNREEQLDRKMRIDDDAGFLVNADRGVALDRDQGPELFVRQLGDCFGDVVHGLAFLAREGKDRVTAQLREAAAQFGLENHHERDSKKDREAANDPADDDQIQQLRNQSQGQKNNREPGEHLRPARSAEIKIAVINPHAQEEDLDKTSPAFDPELEKLMHHFAAASKSASVARKAATFSLTS